MLTSRQISEWWAYYSIEPWGERPKWLRHGIRAALLANIHRGKNAQPFKSEDFMAPDPGTKAAPKQQTVEEQVTILKQIGALGKRMMGRGKP